MGMASKLKVVVVGKPWRGGLYAYLIAALRDTLGEHNVSWLSTKPRTVGERLLALKGPQHWTDHLIRTLEHSAHDLAIFTEKSPIFAALSRPERNMLWMFDSAEITPDLAAAMGHIFISDSGYLNELNASVPAAHNAGFLPLAMLPAMHHRPARARARHGMCFIGNHSPKRDIWLEAILSTPLRCNIYGNYYPKTALAKRYPGQFHPGTSNAGMQQVYARHAVSLNIHADVVREATNMRSFEAAGYGIAQLVEYRPGLEMLFDLERELPTFSSMDMLITQHARLLADSAWATTIANNAHARVLAEHTYHHRVATMLARMD
jgi:spore maturation protein CgeB